MFLSREQAEEANQLLKQLQEKFSLPFLQQPPWQRLSRVQQTQALIKLVLEGKKVEYDAMEYRSIVRCANRTDLNATFNEIMSNGKKLLGPEDKLPLGLRISFVN